MRWEKGLALVNAVLLGCAGCDGGIVDLRDDLYAVHAVLVTGSDIVEVQVTRLDPRLVGGEQGVPGLTVQLVTGADTLRLLHEGADPETPSSGRYTARLAGGVRDGALYELLVTLPGGARVRGSTRALPPPSVSTPQPWTRLHLSDGSVPIRVTATEAVSGEATLVLVALYQGDAIVPGATCRYESTIDPDRPPLRLARLDSITIGNPYCIAPDPAREVAWDSMDVSLRVAVFDSVYHRYAESTIDGSAMYLPVASFGIHGGAGLFAGAAQAATPLRLIR